MEVVSANNLIGNDEKIQWSYFGMYVLELAETNYFVHQPIYGSQDVTFLSLRTDGAGQGSCVLASRTTPRQQASQRWTEGERSEYATQRLCQLHEASVDVRRRVRRGALGNGS